MVQNSAYLYGDSMDLYEIISLTTHSIMIDELLPSFRSNMRTERNIEDCNVKRYHHIDLHYLKFVDKDGKQITVRYEWVGLFDGDYNNGRRVGPMNISRCQDLRKH